MTVHNLYDNTNRLVSLGAELGRGGEGSVFEIAGSPDRVAKVYHKPPAADTQAKLHAMVGLAANKELLKVAAWPTATLHDGPSGRAIGLVMPRINGFKELHTLYSPAHRKTTFPEADWAFLIHCAMNCAIAFDSLHRNGVVIGDVNQSNVLVSAQATVALIDCDSFQIALNGRCFPCAVGVPLFTPPELQKTSFRGLERTPNHDRFGLAVLIFHLLMMGRHPFSGRFYGRGDMPLEQAIEEYRFAYGRLAAGNEMAPPLHTLPLTVFPSEIIRLFEWAFSKTAVQPNARPSPSEWVAALDRLRKQLKTCSVDTGHVFPTFLSSCPWCDLMTQRAPNFFIAVAFSRSSAANSAPVFVLATVWAQIERVSPPNTTYQRPRLSQPVTPISLPPGVPSRIPPRVVVGREFLQRVVGYTAIATGISIFPSLCVSYLAIFALIAFLSFGAWWFLLELLRRGQERNANAGREANLAAIQDEADKREATYRATRESLEAAEQNWREAAASHEAIFRAKLDELRALRDHHAGLLHAHNAERQQLRQNARAMQWALHLQQQFISDHAISDIGSMRKATLASYGIETAWDIERNVVLAVPGFGPKLTEKLLNWRRERESLFG